jgi:hypothetical protein
MKTYLSGGIEYASGFGNDWRNELESWIRRELHHEIFNPCVESINFFERNFPEFERKFLKKEPMENIRKIIGELVIFECEEIIKNSDYIICFWDESCSKGAGTQGELTIAKYYHKPVYIVSSITMDQIPSWIIGCSTEIFQDFDELKRFLLSSYSK